MKLALIIALAPDRRSGRVLSDILPADKAIDQVKRSINGGECPDARFPIIRAISLDSKLREHRFRVSAADIEEDSQLGDLSGSASPDSLIPVEIGTGEQAVIINVSTQEEADFIKQLADGALSNCNEIIRIQKAMADEMAAHQANKAALAKQEAAASVAIGEIAQLGTVIEAGKAELETWKTEAGKRDQRIKELEAQLAEAAKAKKK